MAETKSTMDNVIETIEKTIVTETNVSETSCTENNVKTTQFSSTLLDLLKILGSVNLTFNSSVLVRGQLQVHVDEGQAAQLDVDECVHVTDHNLVQFVSNTFSHIKQTTTDQRRDFTQGGICGEDTGDQIAGTAGKDIVTETLQKGIDHETLQKGIDRETIKKDIDHETIQKKKSIDPESTQKGKEIDQVNSGETLKSDITTKSLTQENGTIQKSSNHASKYCDRVFDRKIQLTRHEETVHINPEKPANRPRVFTKPARNIPLLCSDCGEKFLSYYKLEQHLLRHSGSKNLECPECGKKFSRYINLYMHKKTHAGRPHVCNECGQSYKSISSLKDHKNVHTGAKPYHCKDCNSRFSTSGKYYRHVSKHQFGTGKPLVCAQCKKCFENKISLIRHEKRHNRVISREKKFVCEDCGKAFATSNYLSAHRKIHSVLKPFSCDECGMSFPMKKYLTKHKLVHLSTKPFICDICSKDFSHSYDLKIHKRRHAGEK